MVKFIKNHYCCFDLETIKSIKFTDFGAEITFKEGIIQVMKYSPTNKYSQEEIGDQFAEFLKDEYGTELFVI